MPENTKIVRLEAENVLRLQAVDIHFDPEKNTYIIGGNNEQGKSSVMDAICMALGGQSKVPPMPIHGDKKKGYVVVTLDNLIVTRRFSDKQPRGYLEVTTRDGKPVPGGPQKILDELIGKLTFDPLEFVNMDSKKQSETLRELVGIDFSGLDASYKKAEEERRIVNREVKSLENQINALPFHHDAPKERLQANELAAEMKRRINVNNEIEELTVKQGKTKDQIEFVKSEIARLQRELVTYEREFVEINEKLKSTQPEDVDEINQKMKNGYELNRKFDENHQRTKLKDELEEKRSESDAYTEQMDDIKSQKADTLSKADFPLPGLMFDDEYGVTYKGVPFCQCSQAEQLTVSVSMGFALNPKLKALFVRSASLLDDEHLKIVQDLARRENGQLFLETVGKDKSCYVIIEDGRVE